MEIDRWSTDERASTYADKNRIALESGANIKRVYVISPNVTEAMMDAIEETLIQHLGLNDNSTVERAGGRMGIGVLHHEDMNSPGLPRDFAIFDETAVLFENFNPDWTSTFHGQLTKDEDIRKEYSAYFESLWKASEVLKSEDDVKAWAARMRNRIASGQFATDVFFGYADAASDTAEKLIRFIEKYHYTVFNWKDHFRPGANLLDEIEDARDKCRLGLFLFTGDDLPAEGDPTPRDNVILEYGYFLGSKQDQQVVIVVEEGTEKPTDVDGTICIYLPERTNVNTIGGQLRDWLEEQLGPRGRRRR